MFKLILTTILLLACVTDMSGEEGNFKVISPLRDSIEIQEDREKVDSFESMGVELAEQVRQTRYALAVATARRMVAATESTGPHSSWLSVNARLTLEFAMHSSQMTQKELKLQSRFFEIDDLATYYGRRGSNAELVRVLTEGVELSRSLYGCEHFVYVDSVVRLAGAYREGDQKEKSHELLEDILPLLVRIYGDSHPEAMKSYHQLAFLEAERGNYQKAKELQLQTLEIYRKHGLEVDKYRDILYWAWSFAYADQDYETTLAIIDEGLAIPAAQDDAEAIKFFENCKVARNRVVEEMNNGLKEPVNERDLP